MEYVLDAASEHLGSRVNMLLGHPSLSASVVTTNWAQRKVIFADQLSASARGERISIELRMGVPIISLNYMGSTVQGVLDSGAALSYVPHRVAEGLEETGRATDFYPMFGEFETPTYNVPVQIGGRALTLRAGVLPPLLTMSLELISNGWIVGIDFWRDREIALSYADLLVLDAPCSSSL
jgi:hypothetical protein